MRGFQHGRRTTGVHLLPGSFYSRSGVVDKKSGDQLASFVTKQGTRRKEREESVKEKGTRRAAGERCSQKEERGKAERRQDRW
jgi:hypothetical protein